MRKRHVSAPQRFFLYGGTLQCTNISGVHRPGNLVPARTCPLFIVTLCGFSKVLHGHRFRQLDQSLVDHLARRRHQCSKKIIPRRSMQSKTATKLFKAFEFSTTARRLLASKQVNRLIPLILFLYIESSVMVQWWDILATRKAFGRMEFRMPPQAKHTLNRTKNRINERGRPRLSRHSLAIAHNMYNGYKIPYSQYHIMNGVYNYSLYIHTVTSPVHGYRKIVPS
jgi:hypothetical protein